MLVSKTKPCTCKIGIGFTASAVCSLLICGQLIITVIHLATGTFGASQFTRITLSNAAIILE
jgi:hypothetical protein